LGKWGIFENKKIRVLLDNKKIWGTVLIVILIGSIGTLSLSLFPKGTFLGEAYAGTDVMTEKVIQAAFSLNQPGFQAGLYNAAVNEILEALALSNLIVLCSQDSLDSCNQYNTWRSLVGTGILAFGDHLAVCVDTSCERAHEARNFLQVLLEATSTIANETEFCDPLAPEVDLPDCAKLLDGDEGLTIDLVYGGFAREVRNPFFYGIFLSPTPQEDVRVIPALKNKECSAVMKETAGWKVVVRPIKIPIWIEPWFARATIVGFTTVWVWEYIPMEFIKTIEYCNINSDIVQQIETEVVIDRALMHMWKFWPKDP